MIARRSINYKHRHHQFRSAAKVGRAIRGVNDAVYALAPLALEEVGEAGYDHQPSRSISSTELIDDNFNQQHSNKSDTGGEDRCHLVKVLPGVRVRPYSQLSFLVLWAYLTAVLVNSAGATAAAVARFFELEDREDRAAPRVSGPGSVRRKSPHPLRDSSSGSSPVWIGRGRAIGSGC